MSGQLNRQGITNMRTVSYELQGKEVPEVLRGRAITIRVADTVQEAATVLCASEENVVDKFNDGNVIRLQGRCRGRAAKALKDANGNVDVALASLQTFVDGDKYEGRTEGSGAVRGPKTAKGKQTAVAASSGNRLFEKCLADDTFLGRMVKQGIVDQAEFDAWKAAREEATKEAAATPAVAAK